MYKKLWIVIVVVLLGLGFSNLTVQAQSGDSQYFPDTGHYVNGEFLVFYNANEDARFVFGLPITEAFTDPKTGVLVQYFENVRFELHPNNPPGAQVVLTPLGGQLYERGTIIDSVTAATPNCHMLGHWSYPVCFSFYEFYMEYGGEAHFGLPVSGLEYLDGRLVQFFQNGKLVWKPENIEGAKVTIAPLGLQYFYFNQEDPNLLQPIKNFEYNLNINKIHARAFSKRSIISNGSSQALSIIVVDQNKVPLTGGVVHVTLYYPDGEVVISNNHATDKYGLAEIAFNASSSEPGVVKAVITVYYNDLETTTVTSFRIWY